MSDEVVQMTLDKVLVQITASVADATKEYGPQAVDLALTVYQIEAIKSLLIAFVILIGGVLYANTFKSVRAYSRTLARPDQDLPYIPYFIFGVIVVVVVLAAVFSSLLNPFNWVAAFGNPEALIAYKALQAAGMM